MNQQSSLIAKSIKFRQCSNNIRHKTDEIIIIFVERNPCDGDFFLCNPIADECRLAETCGRGDERQRTRHRVVELLDKTRAQDKVGACVRDV